ncbi:MAG: hypothetical protein F6J93_08345 [Oscillatoria sp. SIO1A7]|nr:hypothetical protein [Oscillatoria sp. SIO1A7]
MAVGARRAIALRAPTRVLLCGVLLFGVWENFILLPNRFRELESPTVTEVSGFHRDDTSDVTPSGEKPQNQHPRLLPDCHGEPLQILLLFKLILYKIGLAQNTYI